MNLSGLEDLIPPLAQWLGVEPSTLLLFVGILVIVARIVARMIPDDQVDWLGKVRKVAGVISVDVANRITPGVTTTDVAKAVVTRKVTEIAQDLTSESKTVLRDQLSEVGKD